ncbi:MAG: PAS domain S-box protein [Desulfobacterales bacterium]|nr:PAS domain S-box protein [Desulfobacterales bacterium]
MIKKATYEELEQRVAMLESRVAAFERNEASLKESERRYRALLDFAPYPVAAFTLKGDVSYLNPAFTEVFGWTFEEMSTGKTEFIPPELTPETSEKLKELFKERTVTRYVTRRRAKDGRFLDVIARGAVFSKEEMGVAGELVIFRDITREKRVAMNNAVMLRISLALPNYPDLEDLLDYIAVEIKRLMNTQGALVILLDDERKEFFFPGAASDNDAATRRIKEIRLPVDSMASGNVVKTGKPAIVNDAFKDSNLYKKRDMEFGYSFNNYVLVPVHSSDRIIGVLAAFNKTDGLFEQTDMELLEMIAGTVGLSIENARFSDELKKSHKELTSLDRAKGKAINHLSHELKTPVAIFSGTLNILEKKLENLPDKTWKRSMERSQRNVRRLKRLQDEINDIILEKESGTGTRLSFLMDQCADLFEDTLENESGDPQVLDRVRERINSIFKIKKNRPETILLNDFVNTRMTGLAPEFSHRNLNIYYTLDPVPPISMPVETLEKITGGLIKNAVENTPDHGRIGIITETRDNRAVLKVKDHGIGILKDHRKRIFEGFFTTQETTAYSSGTAFDFNAGGRGADLLRMRIFSERYGFSIRVRSDRCKFIPLKTDICPGDIEACPFCETRGTCYQSGGSVFTVTFGG